MRTKKCAALVEGCLSFLLFAFLFMDWLFLALIIPVFMVLFAGVVLFYGKELEVQVDHHVSDEQVFEDDIIHVSFTIKNNGRTIPVLEFFDNLPENAQLTKGCNYGVISLQQGEELTISYDLCYPVRGRYQIGPLYLRIRDHVGMFFHETIIQDTNTITVIPPLEDIGSLYLHGKPNPYPGIMQTKRAGIGTEFFGIREYAPGDTYKRINWKAFARWGTPMVNEFELESTTDVILMLDTRGIQTIGTLKNNPLEYGVKAAASLASHLLKQRDRVGFIGYGHPEGHLQWVYPEMGKKQLYKILQELVGIQGQGLFSFQAAMNTASVHMLPAKSLIILISSLEDDPLIAPTVEDLIAQGHTVQIVSPSPVHIEYELSSKQVSQDLAYHLLSFERENMLQRLRRRGAQVVDWHPSEPLSLALKEVERAQWRR